MGSATELVVSIIVFVIAGVLLLLGILYFTEHGFLLNNTYIYASKEERERMDKKPYYRQSAIVFCLLSAVFIVIGLSIVLHNYMLELLEIPLLVGTLIYAVVSTGRIRKQGK